MNATRYETFVETHRKRLLDAFVARYGVEIGHEATADTLAYAFEHWVRVGAMSNPLGYLYRVGQSSARKQFRWSRSFPLPEPPPGRLPDVEPGLPGALMMLTHEQRVIVMLVHGHDWSYADVAALLEESETKVRNSLHSAMTQLRKQLIRKQLKGASS